jgi:hypothetical protein
MGLAIGSVIKTKVLPPPISYDTIKYDPFEFGIVAGFGVAI